MKVFYSENMLAEIGHHTSPSSMKPKAVADALKNNNLRIKLVEPEVASVEDLVRAHDPAFVAGVLNCTIANGFGNSLPAVAKSLPYTNGAMISAARAAIRDGIAGALVSGFHHAGYAHAAGFCTFNGLMVAALKMRAEGLAHRIAIIDCDQHAGDGTDDIIRELGLKDILHISYGYEYHSRQHAPSYMGRLMGLDRKLDEFKADLVLYQAGADAHIDDPLGGVFTTDELCGRDRFVFSAAHSLGIPIAWNLAGGYQRDADGGIRKVVEIHMNTAAQAATVLHHFY